MARGYPDFYGQQIFPKYGTPTSDFVVLLNCPNGATTQAFSINGPGRTYGGSLHFFSTNNSPNFVQLAVTIDGVLYNTYSLLRLLERNYTQRGDYFVQLLQYDAGDDEYELAFLPDFTFYTSITVSVINNCGAALLVTGELLVSLML